MCGIAGIYNVSGPRVDLGRLDSMGASLFHRGPDEGNTWLHPSGKLGFTHRRLQIIDLSPAGGQPMHYPGGYTITFNGEIYNYIELRRTLELDGFVFRSESDTEVLLAAYKRYGIGCLKYLDGMFAFALWDEREQELVLARDRFGQKPLYYHRSKSGLLFASEMKALFVAGVPCESDPDMMFKYLAYDMVADPERRERTFYRNIDNFPAGHYMRLRPDGDITLRPYWSIDLRVENPISYPEACEGFRDLLKTSVERRLRADVAVGSSLSGGLDSSTIVLLMDQVLNGGTQKTFSARFKEPAIDEGRYMEMVVQNRDIEAHYTWPAADALSDDLDAVFHHQEEPFGTASIFAQWAVMRSAKEQNVRVLLDGQGADETMAGYLHYFNPFFRQLYRRDRRRFRSELTAFEELYGRAYPIGMRFRMEAYAPGLVRSAGVFKRLMTSANDHHDLQAGFVHSVDRHPPFAAERNNLNEALLYDTQVYGLQKLLRYSDRNAMAFSREVRLPFLSAELVRFLFALPAEYKISQGRTKSVLRDSFAHLLPEPVCRRVDKLGFETPQESWLQLPRMRERIEEAKTYLRAQGILAKPVAGHDWRYLMAHLTMTKKWSEVDRRSLCAA